LKKRERSVQKKGTLGDASQRTNTRDQRKGLRRLETEKKCWEKRRKFPKGKKPWKSTNSKPVLDQNEKKRIFKGRP